MIVSFNQFTELENFIQELDSRQKRKLFKKPRIQSTPLVGSPPKNAPAWTVQNQGMPNTAVTMLIYVINLKVCNFVGYACCG